jgi:type IV secretory pathway VirJ component
MQEKPMRHFGLLLALLSTLSVAAPTKHSASNKAKPQDPGTETVEFGRFGKVALYRPTGQPSELVLFLSGDGGWSLGVIDMAKRLAEDGALVAGIDIIRFKNKLLDSSQSCLYPAGDLESLAHFLEGKFHFPRYVNPILVGYSSGATMAYTTLAQAPSGTFKGGLSLGFCPDLPWSKPMCNGSGAGLKNEPAPKQGFIYHASPGMKDSWKVMQGDIDQVCDKDATRQFVAEIPGAEFILLPKVGHGYSVEKNYLPQYLDAYRKLASVKSPVAQATLPTSVADLPLVEIPSAGGAANDVMAIILTGDGGWAGLDREVADALASRGVPVVGWDSLRYYWEARNPEVAAKDLSRIIQHYSQSWKKPRVILVGYSMGADVLPFLLNRLAGDARARVVSTALLGLSSDAFFEFHVGQWVGAAEGGLAVAPEMRRLKGANITCIYGKEETDSLCRALSADVAHRAELGGGHHFGGDYQRLGELILGTIPARPAG